MKEKHIEVMNIVCNVMHMFKDIDLDIKQAVKTIAGTDEELELMLLTSVYNELILKLRKSYKDFDKQLYEHKKDADGFHYLPNRFHYLTNQDKHELGIPFKNDK